MWKDLFVFDLIPFVQHVQFYISFDKIGLNGFVNALFWCCIAFGVVYFYFHRAIQALFRIHKIKQHKSGPTIRSLWNICFFAASILFLTFYHKYFLADRIVRDAGRWFPKYQNALFLPTDNCSLFNSITLILITFYVTSAFLDLREKDFADAAMKSLYVCVLISFDNYGYENYSIVLNTVLGIFYLFTDCLMTISLHTKEKNIVLFRIYLFLRILSWSYIFLNLLPFKYLIPTLYAKKFKLWLNVFMWIWYGSAIWNSPILQYFYHQIYHVNSNECIGNNSISRCILIKDSPDLRHYNNLMRSFLEIKLTTQKKFYSSDEKSDNASAATFQTIKCMMTLKRKLRKLRNNNEVLKQIAQQ